MNKEKILILENLWADVFALKIRLSNIDDIKDLEKDFQELLDQAYREKASLVMSRVSNDDVGASAISDLLTKFAFIKKGRRIEFRREVSQLPNNDGSPLLWKNAEELNWSPEKLGPTLKEIAQGDPETDPNEDPVSFMQDFLTDPVLTSGLQCIHIGCIESEVAALAVVQIHPGNGWSRISYMGLAPKFRNRNLGKWVHRYGFHRMKAEGGITYVGGTSSQNAAMIKLFENSGCTQFREMDEWHLQLKAGAPE